MENELVEKAKQKLITYGQEHVLAKYEQLSEEKKQKLIEQILDTDFEQISKLYEQRNNLADIKGQKIEPIQYIDKLKLSDEEKEKYKNIGINLIKAGQVATVTVAGGQGSRLGHNGPKGTFDFGLESHKSIFEVLSDTLKEECSLYGGIIPWYIMTSVENNDETVRFFKEHNFFGYPEDKIKFFKQGVLPIVDIKGKLMLTQEGLISKAADGHGGVFEAMNKNRIIDEMIQKDIKWVFIGPVDNILVKLVDPILVGISETIGAKAGGKSIIKANPDEKVGVFCTKNGKPAVIEYTEIPEELSHKTDNNGNLVFAESHINCNMFSRQAIEEISKNKLTYHSAFKKSKYVDEQGNVVTPTEPNSYKFESFMFEAFERMDKIAVLRVLRQEEFAPIKNATGVDSAQTARELYNNYIKN